MDSGIFRPLQLAAVKALGCGEDWFSALNAEYCRRREAAGHIFDILGVRYDKGSAGLFLWGKVPEKVLSHNDSEMTPGERLSEAILHEAGVFITPGYIFGHNGENYIRASLCAPVPVLEKAAEKIKRHLEKIENQVFI